MSDQILPHYLQRLLEDSSEEQEKIKWSEIFHEIHRKVGAATFNKPLNNLCKLLLEALKTGSWSDRSIVLKIILFYARYLDSCFEDRGLRSGYLTLWKTKLSFFTQSINYVLYERNYSSTRDRPSLSSDGSGLERVAWVALKVGDFQFLSVLVQNGFWQGSMDREEISHQKDFNEFWRCMKVRTGTTEDWLSHQNSVYKMWHDLRRTHGRIQGDNGRGCRRIPLILRVLKAVALQPECQESYLKCLRICFDTLPDPFVSSDEVRAFLLYLMKEDSDRQVVDSFVEKYIQLFDEQPYCPRSLTHLCRYKVRNLLDAQESKSVTLSKLVEDLPVPNNLKAFILGGTE